MRNLTVEMSRAAYETYENDWGEKNFSKEALVKYIDKTGCYLGKVVDIAVTD